MLYDDDIQSLINKAPKELEEVRQPELPSYNLKPSEFRGPDATMWSERSQAAQDRYDAKYEYDQEVANRSFWTKFDAIMANTTTGAVVDRVVDFALGNDEEAVEGYNPSTEDYYEVINAHGLMPTRHNMKYLMSANSPDQLERYGLNLKLKQDASRVAADHPYLNGLLHAVDPVESFSMIFASMATGGAAGALSFSGRVARVANSASQAAAITGSMYLAGQLGVEYKVEDYVIAAASGFLLTHLTNKSQFQQLYKRDELKKATKMAKKELKAESSVKVKDANAQSNATVVKKVAADEAGTHLSRISQAGAEATKRIKEINTKLTNLKNAVESKAPNLNWAYHLPKGKGYSAAVSNLNKAKSDLHKALDEAEILERSAKGDKWSMQEMTDNIKQMREELKHLDRDEALLDFVDISKDEALKDIKEARALYKESPNKQIDELTKELNYLEDLNRPHNAIEADILDLHNAQNRVNPKYTAEMEAEDLLGKLSDVIGDPKLTQEVFDRAMEIMVKQKGYIGARSGVVAKSMNYIKELLSEFEGATKGNPRLRALVGLTADDPILGKGANSNTATSVYRQLRGQIGKTFNDFEDTFHKVVVNKTGQTDVWKSASFTTKYAAKKAEIGDSVYFIMSKRNDAAKRGHDLPVHPDDEIMEIVTKLERHNSKVLKMAKDSNLRGFEDIEDIAGYISRVADPAKLLRIGKLESKETIRDIFKNALMRGTGNYTEEEAKAIARAYYNRLDAKGSQSHIDLNQQGGFLESENMIAMLREDGASAEVIKSIEHSFGKYNDAKGTTKYAKPRLEFDMTAQYRGDKGVYTMMDFVDTDTYQIVKNYTDHMTGRSSLSKVGIGGDEKSVQAHLQDYRRALYEEGFTGPDANKMYQIYESMIASFTSDTRAHLRTGPVMLTLKNLANATYLGATGLWQVGEFGIIAARHGAVATIDQMLKKVPVVKSLLKDIGNNPKLVEEFETALNLKVTEDLRMTGFRGRVAEGYDGALGIVRFSEYMRDITPIITGQRMVQKAQTDMVMNLYLAQVYKASTGDARALKILGDSTNLITPEILAEVKAAAKLNKLGGLESLGLQSLSDEAIYAIQNGAFRHLDTTVVQPRIGHGASYQHNPVGALLGQFTGYTVNAHNAILRKELHKNGVLGLANIALHQYPIMFAMAYLNEIRRGNVVDLDDSDAIAALAWKSITYSAPSGALGEFVNTLSGGGRSAASLEILKGPTSFWDASEHILDENYGAAGVSLMQGISKFSALNSVPAVAPILKHLKEEYEE